MGLGCSYWSLGFPLQSPITGFGGFLPYSHFPFNNFTLNRACLLKKKAMVIRLLFKWNAIKVEVTEQQASKILPWSI